MLPFMLWIIYPYMVVAILVMGVIWRMDTTKLHEGEQVYKKQSLLVERALSALLVLCLLTGLGVFAFYNISDDPKQLLHWVISLAYLEPDMDLIRNISFLSRLHFILILTLLLALSFTKYLSYLIKPHLYLRNRFIKKLQ
ncbi:respiratory nitrate reductase subunit gamma [Bacillus sp. 31A1R]|uniref:Respiratory nitrate reductase subunit gamma n=1 Tax=Robertmurraya mangrovi TaxID=3098077 RepID=A0ABU5IT70_9BACI|nr:respiratory nitrate reductase subunit gamma [Bacillus sp. 31A1R]MDZ5470316.1 respiratory nitrate reductase subunit gamma [Bacillus sp. 31A1R]